MLPGKWVRIGDLRMVVANQSVDFGPHKDRVEFGQGQPPIAKTYHLAADACV